MTSRLSIPILCILFILSAIAFGIIMHFDTMHNVVSITTEELIAGSEDWSINPCKYTYENIDNRIVTVFTTISNKSNGTLTLDAGDGTTVTIPAKESIEHCYKVRLDGNTTRFFITRLNENSTGICIREGLILKITQEGGENR